MVVSLCTCLTKGTDKYRLPGAIGMYALSLAISNVGATLPAPAYALLSGLNAATVGVIALAAVQLSQKTITDKLFRLLVFFGATAGMLYNALWFFPVLILSAAPVTIVWDLRWLHGPFKKVVRIVRTRETEAASQDVEMSNTGPAVETTDAAAPTSDSRSASNEQRDARIIPRDRGLKVSWKLGAALIIGFFAAFTAVMVVRGIMNPRPLLFNLFSILYLAGTIVFGGGPVVIPLLRQ